MEMIIAKIVKDFSEAKDKKSGKRLFGWDPPVGSVKRWRKEDFDIVAAHGLVEEVKPPKPEPKRRRRRTTTTDEGGED